MANWWDTMGMTIGDNLIGMQMPFGMAPPTDPQQRAAMINPMLVNIGATMLANRGKNPAANLGLGLVNAQQAGMGQLGKSLYARQIMNSEEDRRDKRDRENQTIEWLKKTHPNLYYPGMTGEDAGKMFQSTLKTQNPVNWQMFDGPDGTYAFNPETRQTQKIGDAAPKAGRTQKTQINGHDVLVNLDTGEVMKDYGPTQSRAQTIPIKAQNDLIAMEQAVEGLNTALDDYGKLIKGDPNKGNTGTGTWTGTFGGQGRDALGQQRTNISMKMKEAYELGVLNGPDYMLMQQMLFDPRLEMLDPIGNVSKVWSSIRGGTDDRATASIAGLKKIMSDALEAKKTAIKKVAAGGMTTAQPEMPQTFPGTPEEWGALTPEEQALWTSQ